MANVKYYSFSILNFANVCYMNFMFVAFTKNIMIFFLAIFSFPLDDSRKIFFLNNIWLQIETCRLLSMDKLPYTPPRPVFFY